MQLPALNGRTYAITGANAGLGRATTAALAAAGARVLMLCRRPDRGTEVADAIRARSPEARLEVLPCDLARLASVRDAASAVRATTPNLDGFVNNAGTFDFERRATADGFEHTMAVNHLGPFLLTRLVLPALRGSDGRAARVVNLAGMVFRRGHLDFDDLQLERDWSTQRANQASQLARVLFTQALARRCDPRVVTAVSVHPGGVLTDAQRRLSWPLRLLIHTVMRPGFVRPERGAQTILHALADPSLEGTTGRHYHKHRDQPLTGEAADEGVQERLWSASSRLVGLDEDLAAAA